MIVCDKTTGQRFLTGELSPGEESWFVDHLDSCAMCRRMLEDSAGGEVAVGTARSCLAYSDSTDAFADDSPKRSAVLSAAMAQLAPTDDPLSLGRIGNYEVRSIIGRGGFGIVFKAYDRALNRNVAIKSLDPMYASVAAARQRFAREAKAMAAVSHEHVVPVYGVDEHREIPYFVMEYVAGGTLEGRLRRGGPLDPTSIVTIALQTAQALAAAHRHGLVHRDIKPANILLDEGTERVRVTDFGLARVANDVNCTRSGFVVGTPQYMAPEQVRGDACDGRSDLFSLGAVMYEMAVGHAPFRGDGVYAVMQRIVHDTPRGIRQQNPSIPRWLEGLIETLLAKSADERFASADELVETLQRELAHLQSPTMVRPPPRPWLKSEPLLARSNARRLAIAAIVLPVIAGLVWLGFVAPNRPRQDGQANRLVVSPGGTTRETSGDENRESMLVIDLPSVPLWDRDGTRELQQQVDELERRWNGPGEPTAYELWRTTTIDSRWRTEWLMWEEQAEARTSR